MKISLIRKLAGMGTALAAASLISAAMMPSAQATGVVAGVGTAHLPKFPCDPSVEPAGTCVGTSSLTGAAISTVAGDTKTGTISANFTYNEPTGLTCPTQGTADGNITGAFTASFHWQRIGLVALVGLTNVNSGTEPNGTVVAVFAPTPAAPLNQPRGCDGTATASGVLAVVAAGGTL